MSESFPKVEVSIFSSLLPPSLSLLRKAAPEPTHDYWSPVLEYNALPWHQACNRPNRYVSQPHVFMRKGVCTVFASNSPILLCADQRADEADLPCSGERGQKATGRCKGLHKVLPTHWVYLDRGVFANEILHLARYSIGVECVWRKGHIWREEWEQISEFTSY